MLHPDADGLGRREMELDVKCLALEDEVNRAVSARKETWIGLCLILCIHTVLMEIWVENG